MTSQLPLPSGAQPIAEARQRGQKPAEGIFVSYVGLTPWDAHHVLPEPGKLYDWSWGLGLQIHIVVKPGIDAKDAIHNLYDPFNPDWLLGIIDIERKAVSFVLSMNPPKLWHRTNVSDYFPETAQCN